MDEQTEALIQRLAGELRPVQPLRKPGLRAVAWLAIVLAGTATLVGFHARHAGVAALRADALEWALLALAAASCVICAFAAFHHSVPGASMRWRRTSAAVVAAWAGLELLAWAQGNGLGRWGSSASEVLHCLTFLLVAGLAATALAHLMLRRAGSPSPLLVATLAGLAGAAAACCLLALVHPHRSTGLDLCAHGLAALSTVLLSRRFAHHLDRMSALRRV